MKYTRHIRLIGLLLIFAFWYLVYPGHLWFWEANGFFALTPDYLKDHLTAPGGWSSLGGHFLAQFYKWPLAAAAIQTAFAAILWGITGGLFALNHKKKTDWALLIPVGLLWIIQCHAACTPVESLRCVLMYGLLAAYGAVRATTVRRLLPVVLFPILFVLLPTGSLFFLYLSLAVFEWRRTGGYGRWVWYAVYLAILLVFPILWSRWVYQTAQDALYLISPMQGDQTILVLLLLLYLYPALLPLPMKLKLKRPVSGRRLEYTGYVLLLVALAAGIWSCGWDGEAEKNFRIRRMLSQKNWKGILDTLSPADCEKDSHRTVAVTLALGEENLLGERLFFYPVYSAESFYYPLNYDAFPAYCNSLFYENIGIINEAIHQSFQAAIKAPEKMDFENLRRLIELHIQNGNLRIAQKYMNILGASTCHKAWIKSRIAQGPPPVLPSNEAPDLFIGARPFLSDMARVFDKDPKNEKVLNYILCSLLLNKDMKRFTAIFSRYYPHKQGTKLPRHYEEALLLAKRLTQEVEVPDAFVMGKQAQEHFEAFMQAYQQNGNQLPDSESYAHTYWHYFYNPQTDGLKITMKK